MKFYKLFISISTPISTNTSKGQEKKANLFSVSRFVLFAYSMPMRDYYSDIIFLIYFRQCFLLRAAKPDIIQLHDTSCSLFTCQGTTGLIRTSQIGLYLSNKLEGSYWFTLLWEAITWELCPKKEEITGAVYQHGVRKFVLKQVPVRDMDRDSCPLC